MNMITNNKFYFLFYKLISKNKIKTQSFYSNTSNLNLKEMNKNNFFQQIKINKLFYSNKNYFSMLIFYILT